MTATLWKPEFVEQARKICELGATDLELAGILGISEGTVNNWKHVYPEFAAALVIGKEVADTRVKRSLYNRAVGYSFEAEKIMQYMGEVVRASYIEHVPPDVNATIFWLKNRCPQEFRDIRAVDYTGSIMHRHVEELSNAELEHIARGGSTGTAQAKTGNGKSSIVH